MPAVRIDKARIDRALAQMIASNRAVGTSALIWKDGKEVYFGTAGYADREAKTPMDRNTIVRIFSMTKPVTGVALMTLYEEGEFQLSDPVSKFLPEFRTMQVAQPQGADGNYVVAPARNPITIRHVLTHTSGVQGGGGFLGTQYSKVAPRTVPRPAPSPAAANM